MHGTYISVHKLGMLTLLPKNLLSTLGSIFKDQYLKICILYKKEGPLIDSQ